MAGVPAYITPLSYIAGSGTQYITTSIYLRSTDVIKTKWRFQNSAGNVYGCFSGSDASNNFCLYGGSASNNAYLRYDGQLVRAFKPTSGTIYNIEHGPDGFKAGTVNESFTAATFTCTAPMYIFMLPNSSSAKVTARCYGLRVYRDGALAYNFIPARNELTSAVGMWEAVNGVWYGNAGTGSFTAGTEINYALQPLLLKRRRALESIANGFNVGIPYQRVEFLEFTGSQFIDTGIVPNPMSFGYEYGITFFNDLSGTRTCAGVWENSWSTSNPNISIGGNFGNAYLSFTNNWRAGQTPAQSSKLSNIFQYSEVSLINNNDWDGSKFTLTLQSPLRNEIITFDNPYQGALTGSFVIGGVRNPNAGSGNNGVSEWAHIKVYYFRIMQYDTVIMNLVPVRVGSAGYLYDTVSGLLLGNSGTGQFNIGPDVGGSGTYTLIEYVEGDNPVNVLSQTILDTTIVTPDDYYKFTGEYMKLRTLGNWGCLFAQYYDESSNAWRIIESRNSPNTYYYSNNRKAGTSGSVNHGDILNTKVALSLDKSEMIIANTITSLSAGTAGTENGSTMRLGSGRWYNFKIYHNGTLIQDLRPARDADNELCMVDLVTGKLFHSPYFTNGGNVL